MSTFNEVRHAGVQVLRVWVLCVSLKCVRVSVRVLMIRDKCSSIHERISFVR